MDTGRWQKIEDLFHQALELPPAQRPEFLARSCGSDGELLSEVESLMAATRDADERLGSAMTEALELALDAEGAPEQLGPYRIVRQLGEGGLATVYLAERSDEQYRMTVAIKVVKRGMDTADILRRLRQERQILASLKHPNIAQLLDGGSTDRGQPYVVMEYIDGEPIDAYCRRYRLGLEERLELFRTVCGAVHHAHQNLVIHRDIKPSNLLVSSGGVPKLLDFGIAKLLDPERALATVARTVTGLQLLTPEYASPEQVRGEPLTTATDVYSLGVLLYQLLTGRRPYAFATARPQEIERVICEVEPLPPSTAMARAAASPAAGEDAAGLGATATKRGRRLAGDLDNIVLMALRKEPRRRYASVEQLSEDLGRFLRSQPVIARKDTFSYRTAKFFQRHRGAVIAASLVILALVAGIVGTTRATFVANEQRQRAERHLDEAEEITRFLISLFEVSEIGGARSQEITAMDLLEKGTRQIEVELKNHPTQRASLMSVLGRVHQKQGLFAKARQLLTSALELRREASDLPRAAVSLGELADVVTEEGDAAAAGELLEEALAIQRQLFGDKHRDIAATLFLRAVAARHLEDLDEAERLHREALAMRLELGEGDLEVAESLNGLAAVLIARDDFDGAEGLLRQVLERQRGHFGDEHPEMMIVVNDLAVVLDAQGRFAEAEEQLEKVLELRIRFLGEDHPFVARAYHNLAAVAQAQERFDDAEAWLRRALAGSLESLGEEHPDIPAMMNSLAYSLRRLGRTEEAEQMFLEAEALELRLRGETRRQLIRSRIMLAQLYAEEGRYAEAESLLLETLRIQDDILASDFRRSFAVLQLGELYAARGDCPRALPYLERAAGLRRSLDPEHAHRVTAEQALGRCRADP